MLDSRGLIPLMTPTQALKSIQVMANHSHNWYDETTTRKTINDSPDNVDAIQESFKGTHLTKECPLEKKDKAVEQREKFKARTTMGKENMKEPVPCDLPPRPFQGHLKEQMGSHYKTRETVCMIENPGEVHKMKAQEDEWDMDVGWDIIVKDVERLKQFLIPTIHTLPNLKPVVQPFHITSPDDDYVAPATSPTLDKQLNKFRKECSDILGFPKRQMVTLLMMYRSSQILRHMIVRPSFRKYYTKFQQLEGKFRDRLDL
ncbi:hypothetical protein Tco_0679896 [Tanacetum coccineum]|uniref:Uncharacterized protein n=1 Tax=Tanacetum coccineum TaxID=301880 RepID=A0ABQ4XJT1_9ASTR